MSKYVALFTGKGDGCDYTIDCNKKFEVFEAENHEEALRFCRQVWEDHGGPMGEPRVEEISLYAVSDSVVVPVKKWNTETEEDEESIEDTQEELRQVEERVRELRERLAKGQ